jgi:hypothetical protein
VRLFLALATVAFVSISGVSTAQAITVDQACEKFASKLSEAQASGDKQKAQQVYSQGSQRIASKFNGASCPNVKAPN